MAYQDLREFIARLDAEGELIRVRAPVDPELEITEITDRISKRPAERNKALLFENVRGSDIPVLINMFGSRRRMALALGVDDLDDLGQRLASLLDLGMPKTWGEKLGKLGQLLDVARIGPRTVRRAPCQEVVETQNPSLAGLPILKCWPLDAGHYITLPCVISRDPRSGRRNVGMYRLQVFDERTLGMHWQLHKGGAEHERVAQEVQAARIPVAVALGGDPATIWSGSAPLPPDIDEFLLAGWLRGRPVDLVPCVSQPLEVPADAEIIIEGYVDPREHRLEGPFGDHTGYYSLPDHYPVMHITAITRRQRPIYPTTIVGRPPMEDYWMGKATERLFLPLIRLFLPEIVDINMPAEGVFHNLVIVSIRKRYPGHARKVMYGLWGLGLMMLAKAIIVVDADVNVHNLSEVAWRVTNNIDAGRDCIIVEGPVDALDHAAPRPNYGAKIGIDATRKGPLDGFQREWPPDIVMSPEIKALVDQRWNEYGIGEA
ncbi:MAG: menaquinone biosynthesis decarboxylase [Chloroflexota bacterium]